MSKYVVRYGAMRLIGVMGSSSDQHFPRGTRIIVRTERGLEAGEVLCDASEQVMADLHDPKEGLILREMTADDCNELDRIREQAKTEYEVCARCIADLGLEMQLVDRQGSRGPRHP